MKMWAALVILLVIQDAKSSCGVSMKAKTLGPSEKYVVNGAERNDALPWEPVTYTQIGEFPWLAAIYLKNNTGLWQYRLSGTLITPHIVLTLGDVLVDEDQKPRDPKEFRVVLGKSYKDYYKRDKSSVIADVREVLLHNSYFGKKSLYASEIGILDLAVSVQVSSSIMPASIDWGSLTRAASGDRGYVASWNMEENTALSELGLSTVLVYSNSICIDIDDTDHYLTSDGFWAEISSDHGEDRVPFGGGLTIVNNNGLHTLYGVHSKTLKSASKVSLLFTDIKKPQRMKWLIDQRTYLDEHHLESERGCTLPEHPINGAYASLGCQSRDQAAGCSDTPGTLVPSNWTLSYTCNKDYALTYGDSSYVVCNNGTWDNLQHCIHICPSLSSTILHITCTYAGNDVPCNQTMEPGTTVMYKCKEEHHSPNSYPTITCLDSGEWSQELPSICSPGCGVSMKANTLGPSERYVVNGAERNDALPWEPVTYTQIGDFPWLAAIYEKNETGHWQRYWSGTLITPHTVLTSARALYNEYNEPRKPDEFKVGLGKYFMDYYKDEEASIFVDVREVLLPEIYSALWSIYDIGLLDLKASVQLTSYVMPACIDWTFPKKDVTILNGVVAGWGQTQDSESSYHLQSTQTTRTNISICKEKLYYFDENVFTTSEYLCAETNPHQEVTKLIGAGLTFEKNGLHTLFGVVSMMAKDGPQFLLVNDIKSSRNAKWLVDQLTYLDNYHSKT